MGLYGGVPRRTLSAVEFGQTGSGSQGNGKIMENWPPTDDAPQSMRDPEVRAGGRLCSTSNMLPHLTAFAARLLQHGSVEVPDFDPLDDGVDARILIFVRKARPDDRRERQAHWFGIH